MTRKSSKRKSTRPQVSKRELRSQIAQLKKLGAIDKKINAATVKLTDYRKRQVSAFRPVLRGEADFVKLKKPDRGAYARNTAARKFGSFLIVPKEDKDQRTDVINRGGRDLVRIKTPLGRGEMSQIILPYDAKDMIELATAIQNDDELPDEITAYDHVQQYAFALYGHTTKIGFPQKQDLVDYILINYKHLFDPKAGQANAVKHFVLVSYGGGAGVPPEIPESLAGPKYESEMGHGRYPSINKRGRTDWYENRKAQNKNERRKISRQKMKSKNPAQYEKILEQNRARAKASYDRKQKRAFDNAKFDS